MTPDLAVCIVNWNTRDLLAACLESLDRTRGELRLQVICVDNASRDGSAAMVRARFPEVELLANATNRYYAAANNQALAQAAAPQVLLLNPDIIVHEGALQELLAALGRHPQAGAVAPQLRNLDGSVQRSCRSFPDPEAVLWEALGLSRLFPRSRRLGKYRMTWWAHGDERTVDQPMASALLLRRAALEAVGLFDEQFPMFCNDVDLCRRLWEAGWQVWFAPEAKMTHHHGAGTRQVRRAMIAASHDSLLRYYEKHYRGRVSLPAYWGVRMLLQVGRWWRLSHTPPDGPEEAP